MKVLFPVYHPVDPQVIRFVTSELIKKNHQILIAVFEKEGIIEEIVKSFNLPYQIVGKLNTKSFNKFIGARNLFSRLNKIVNNFKPDIIFSPTSPYTGLVNFFNKIPLVAWADTETAKINLNSSAPFCDTILTPVCFNAKVNEKKHIAFAGYKELAYLHPNWFKPDNGILNKLNINKGEKVILIRFSNLNAMHDIGLESAVDGNKGKLLSYIVKLEKYARVYISMTEKSLGVEFEKYRLNIHPADYVNLLSHCTIYIGEGTTTASEAGVLGIPWINIQSTTRGYLIDQEKYYCLGFRTDNIDLAFEKAIEWLRDNNLKEKWEVKRQKLLSDKIDVSSFLIWFIENYPGSHSIMKANPDYQNRFK